MITNILKTILTDSGCSLVLYDQQQLANLYVDQSNQLDVVGLILQPPDILLEVRANAIIEHYTPLTVEILKQARLEDKAEINEAILDETLLTAKRFITRLIASEYFKTILPIRAVRVLEVKYDANVIGWSLPLDLYYLQNRTIDPCL